MLTHALKIPAVQKIIYTNFSVNEKENETILERSLKRDNSGSFEVQPLPGDMFHYKGDTSRGTFTSCNYCNCFLASKSTIFFYHLLGPQRSTQILRNLVAFIYFTDSHSLEFFRSEVKINIIIFPGLSIPPSNEGDGFFVALLKRKREAVGIKAVGPVKKKTASEKRKGKSKKKKGIFSFYGYNGH